MKKGLVGVLIISILIFGIVGVYAFGFSPLGWVDNTGEKTIGKENKIDKGITGNLVWKNKVGGNKGGCKGKKCGGFWGSGNGGRNACTFTGQCRTNADCFLGYACSNAIPFSGCYRIGCTPTYVQLHAKCLSSSTSIETPSGKINVKELKVGDEVSSLDINNKKSSAKILKISKTFVVGHNVIHLKLEDGRELYASAEHPIIDGRTLGELNIGDGLDNSKIEFYEVVPYDDNYTYDLLPDSDSGSYWANGILLGSTLK